MHQNNHLAHAISGKNIDVAPCLPLCEQIEEALNNYFSNLDGALPTDLYQMVLKQVEVPLLQKIMCYVGDNQSKAAQALGISRGTLRKKLKQYGMD